MFNKKEIQERFTPENTFYTSIIGVFYLFGLYSIFQNFKFLVSNPDLDHFIFLILSVSIWILFSYVYVEKLRYFSETKPKNEEHYLVKPNMDVDHMIWFFVQLYTLVSFFIIYVEWHNTIQKQISSIGIFPLFILSFSFVPFLYDAYKTKKEYFLIGVVISAITILLFSIGFFESGCYASNEHGIREYLVDCT